MHAPNEIHPLWSSGGTRVVFGSNQVGFPPTHQVDAGTDFFVGYDDHYRQGDRINAQVFPGSALQRTNRAIFTKLQYLFRY
jgi:hypothetical protein